MTMINRSAPDAEPRPALTDVELVLLDHLVPDKDLRPSGEKTLCTYLTKITRLGGYLARARDPPPGNTVMWRGLSRLTENWEPFSVPNLWAIESLTGFQLPTSSRVG